jgi:hypothetical protein
LLVFFAGLEVERGLRQVVAVDPGTWKMGGDDDGKVV